VRVEACRRGRLTRQERAGERSAQSAGRSQRCGRGGKQGRYAGEGMGACLVLERRALPQEALVRDMALGLHAGTEGRQHSAAAAAPMAGPTVYTRDDLWKAGLRNDSATDAAVTELCGGTVVQGYLRS
jgi:hypothetical protein